MYTIARNMQWQREVPLVLALTLIAAIGMVTLPTVSCSPARPAFLEVPVMPDDQIQNPSDIEAFDAGVYLFPAKNLPKRLADWIWDHPQTNVVCITPYQGKFLVLTRPNKLPEVIPGSAQHPDDDIPVPFAR